VARNGAPTRERILDGAQRLVLERGFSATTVDAVIDATGTSKGSFFHHFHSKADLGRALVERYARGDVEHLEQFMGAAEAASGDPAEQLVAFVRLFEEAADELAREQPGCLYVSFVYEKQLVGDETAGLIVDAVLAWRRRLAEKIRAAVELHPPRLPVDDVDSLADMVFSTFEGGFILARTMQEPSLLRGQLSHLRRYLELLFGVGEATRARR
jgi:TetR/AcrR family transcriptional repressor of nem operon